MKTDKTLDTSFYIAGWIFLAVAAAVLAVAFILHRDLYHILPPCAFHVATGYYCPGCGATRAVVALLHGRLSAAVYYHPFVGYVAVVGGWFMLSQTIERMTRHRLSIGMHFRYLYAWIGVALLLGNAAVRDLLLYAAGVDLLSG